MNFVRIARLLLGFAVVVSSSFADERLKFFYRAGTLVYAVDRFENGLPVLDTKVEVTEAQNIGNREWTYQGELPVDTLSMSNVYPYRIHKKPKLYWERNDLDSYFAKPFENADEVLPWKGAKNNKGMIVYGWLSGKGEVTDIACSSFDASDPYKASITLGDPGLDPDGRMVAWFLDETGELVPLDKKASPGATFGRQTAKNRKPMDRSKNTALHVAAVSGDEDLVSEFLKGGRMRPDVKNINGQTPLMFAAMAGRSDSVKRLLERGAKVYAVDNSGRCALHYAAESAALDVIKLLVPKAPGWLDNFEIVYAVTLNVFYKGDQDIAIYLAGLTLEEALIKNNGDSYSKGTLKMISDGRVKLATWLLEEHELDASYVSEDGINYIHAAAGYADAELLELLWDKGASVSQSAKNGVTPLLIACGMGNREAICWLIDNGARTEVESAHLDPLLFAVGRRAEESVSCLIDYGFDVNREVENGLTPIMLASLLGERKIAEMLLNAGGLWDFNSPYSDDALRNLIRLDSPDLLNGLFEQGLDRDYRLMGMVGLERVAGFYGARELLGIMNSMTTPGLAAMLNKGKELGRPLSWAFQSELAYPPMLQELYGNLDIEAFFGVLPSGHIGMIQLGDNVPEDLRYPLEESMMNWRFRPTGTDQMVAVKLSIPLRVSLNEEDIFNLREVAVMPKALKQVDPYYPAALKSKGVSGYAVIEWVIDQNGEVLAPRAIEFSHEEFGKAAVQAITQSTWSPAKRDGRPVAVRVKQRMDFHPPNK